jgi:hypothetical protein
VASPLPPDALAVAVAPGPEALELDEPPLPEALEAAFVGALAAAGAASAAGADAAAVAGAGSGAGAGLVAGAGAELLAEPLLPVSLLPHPATVNITARATGIMRCRMKESVVVQRRDPAAGRGAGV